MRSTLGNAGWPGRWDWAAIFAVLTLAVSPAGCDWKGFRKQADATTIAQRRAASLEGLVNTTAAGRLVPFEHALVRIDQGLIENLLRAAMPLDYGVGGQFRILIDSARVDFQDGLAMVRLGGAVRSKGAASGDPFARVTFDAELEVLEFDPALQMLRCRLKLLDFHLNATRSAGASKELIERLHETLPPEPGDDDEAH